MTWKFPMLGLVAVCLFASSVFAHPGSLLDKQHDRTIVVRLQKGAAPNQVRARIEYRLEVLEATVFAVDMLPFQDEINLFDYRGRELEYYAAFTKKYARIYADRFVVEVNKKPVEKIDDVSRDQRFEYEEGKPRHLRCDFIYEVAFDLNANQKTQFVFQDRTYYLEPGQIVLSVVNETGLALESKTEPSEALRKEAKNNPGLADYDRLREVSVVFAPLRSLAKSSGPIPEATSEPKSPELHLAKESHDDRFSLIRLIMDDYGFWLTMVLALFFGAAHALTPGHGKTLVAAYLVGERGTIWHALFLGLVTTLTHTGVVILLAVILTVLPENARASFEKVVQNGLGLVLGLMVACLGFWLLLQRLAGKADHVHIGGGHDHHHGPAPATADSAARPLNWWGLVMLGVTGGIVPCWDAIALLFYSVSSNRLWIVLPAILAFSAGLAGVLVLIGILVVQMPRLVKSQGGDGRFLRALPTVSAIAVILVGIWLCYEWSQGR